jgi:hypothetical protein
MTDGNAQSTETTTNQNGYWNIRLITENEFIKWRLSGPDEHIITTYYI